MRVLIVGRGLIIYMEDAYPRRIHRKRDPMRARKHKGRRDNSDPYRRRRVRWTTWVIVGFMLAAMIMYLVSLDEAIIP